MLVYEACTILLETADQLQERGRTYLPTFRYLEGRAIRFLKNRLLCPQSGCLSLSSMDSTLAPLLAMVYPWSPPPPLLRPGSLAPTFVVLLSLSVSHGMTNWTVGVEEVGHRTNLRPT
ncbi:hypothetical protein LY78DRAFT_500987 [Colletotrichum sublineola]|nr:hypothetical protein LY78DRAFT_500987 [Colletotrichum sublineola]